ncbi:N-acetylglucosaminylphosphatidylinositol deacetylase [Aphelenchoides bicaudatus]|nr:N-acetylglucosaminylphosphatidylinositol deacetylase [Aphelenchoides bicaudatus]
MFLCLLLLFFALFLVVGALFISNFQRRLPVTSNSRCLLLIAHPDDECMFFAPTIVHLLRQNCKFYVICASTGDSEGLGHLRKDELFKSCQAFGIPEKNVTLLHVSGLLDGQPKWETEKLARIVLQHIERLDIDVVITFDERGISAHSNHISCFHALQFLYSNGLVPSDVQIFILETVSLLRKYIGLLDLYPSFFSSTFMVISSPLIAWSSMQKHRTQLVWFRYLYLVFSRYVFLNTLRRISLHRYMIKNKKKE